MLTRWLLFLAFSLQGIAALAQAPQGAAATTDDVQQSRAVLEAAEFLKARKLPESLAAAERVISFYEAKYRDTRDQVYCARGPLDTIFYITRHATAHNGRGAVVVRNWCEAHFLRGYVLVELGRLPEARVALEAAVAMSPWNSQYLSELGNIYLREKAWARALETYAAAEQAVEISDSAQKNNDAAKAQRGAGYALIELGRLADAEEKYRRSLELVPGNPLALGQLRYIAQLRAKAQPPQ
ncbi:MAG TPA: tetratricopeptide repeat protein [Ramlibacter sp.]|nr:tetratricopeptide repeat protein [Ramlibacter sp.]